MYEGGGQAFAPAHLGHRLPSRLWRIAQELSERVAQGSERGGEFVRALGVSVAKASRRSREEVLGPRDSLWRARRFSRGGREGRKHQIVCLHTRQPGNLGNQIRGPRRGRRNMRSVETVLGGNVQYRQPHYRFLEALRVVNLADPVVPQRKALGRPASGCEDGIQELLGRALRELCKPRGQDLRVVDLPVIKGESGETLVTLRVLFLEHAFPQPLHGHLAAVKSQVCERETGGSSTQPGLASVEQ